MSRAIDFLRAKLGDDLPKSMGIKIAAIMDEYLKAVVIKGSGGVWYASHTGQSFDILHSDSTTHTVMDEDGKERKIKIDDCEKSMEKGNKVRLVVDDYIGNKGRVTIGNEYEVLLVFNEETSNGTFESYEIKDDNGNPFWLRKNEVEIVEPQTDKHVENVIKRFKERSEVGMKKYGKTLERNDLSTLEWLIHLQEELMDATLYIQRLKEEFKDRQL